MRLTSELAHAGSPLGRLFRTSFNPKPLLGEIRARVAKKSLVIPRAPGSAHASVIGTAISYRIGFYFKVPNSAVIIPFQVVSNPYLVDDPGVWRDGGKVSYFREGAIRYFSALIQFLRTHRIERRTLPRRLESLLNRHCLTLAKLDSVYRRGLDDEHLTDAGRIYSRFLHFSHRRPDAAVNQILGFFPESMVEEMNTLSRRFAIAGRRLLRAPRWSTHLSPTFILSSSVGGADADLMAGDILVEIKAKLGGVGSDGLFQMLAYKLLDQDDGNGIRRLGLYLARHGVLMTWKVREFYAALKPKKPWMRFKEEFYKAVETTSRHY